MTKIELELHDDTLSIINKIKNINDVGIELVVPEGAVVFENVLNLKMLKEWSDKAGKVLNFYTDDSNGQVLLSALEDDRLGIKGIEKTVETNELEKQMPKQKVKITMPSFRFHGKRFIVFGVLLAILLFGGFLGFKYLAGLPEANVKVVVESQPLTRSFEIRVLEAQATNPQQKILNGKKVTASITDSLSMETTGEKLIGEYAEGTVTIFNKTDAEKKFKKGAELIYEDDDKEYKFVTTEDVTVPARKEQAPDPAKPEELVYIKGSKDVKVEANEFGEKYNLEEGTALSLEGEKAANFEAEVKKDLAGGKEEKIKIVAQEDIDELKKKLAENSNEKAIRALMDTVSREEKLIAGSENVQTSSETLDHELEEEAEELKLEQTFSASGLVYSPKELDDVIDKLVEDFVPEGFVLSTKERTVNVEVLGNSDSSIVSDTEANLQVTLKTFVVTDISEDSIKDSLAGKNADETQRILGSIRNIKTYEFNMSRNLPFFNKVPTDKNRINVTIERD